MTDKVELWKEYNRLTRLRRRRSAAQELLHARRYRKAARETDSQFLKVTYLELAYNCLRQSEKWRRMAEQVIF